jgi:hypothetical protein
MANPSWSAAVDIPVFNDLTSFKATVEADKGLPCGLRQPTGTFNGYGVAARMQGYAKPGFDLIEMGIVWAVELLNESVILELTGHAGDGVSQCADALVVAGRGGKVGSAVTATADRLLAIAPVISVITIIP